MKSLRMFLLVLVTFGTATVGSASDDTYANAVRVFKEAGQNERCFPKAYGDALFPHGG